MEQITNKKSAVDNEVANGNQLSSLPVNSKKSPTKILSEFDRMKIEMSLRAKELLKDCLQSKSCAHEKTSPDGEDAQLNELCCTKDSENKSSEDIDFSIFSNPENFKKQLNLAGKTVKECIVAYAKSKVKHESAHIKCRHLLTYILLIEETRMENKAELMPEVIGLDFLNCFELFLDRHHLSPNTVVGLVCSVKSIMTWAGRYGAKLCNDIEEWKYKNTDNIKPKVALSPEEISKIYYFNIDSLPVRPQKKKTLKRVRALFVLSCFLGQRYSDMIRLEKKNFPEGSFSVYQKKTRHTSSMDFRRIYGRMPYYVKEILEKYNYQSPWTGDISNYNRYLRELMEYIGFDEPVSYEYSINGEMYTVTYKKSHLITSHVGRRTFITDAINRNINSQVIKQASGHLTDRSFGKYYVNNTESSNSSK